jgi:hypothetical protein
VWTEDNTTWAEAPIMKVLVATYETQGQRDNDFCYCVEGELVTVGLVCAADESNPDGGCGCGRAFAGLNSHKATTTAKVKEVELTEEDYVEALHSSLEQQGWPTEDVEELAKWLAELVDTWPTGAIVERRLDDVYIRTEASSAR